EPRLPYNGLRLDRAADRRGDSDWLQSVRQHPGTRVIPLRGDQCMIRHPGRQLVTLLVSEADTFLDEDDLQVFLGVDDDGAGLFTVDLSGRTEAVALQFTGADATIDTRSMFSTLDTEQSAALAYARGLLRWHHDQQYCGACGGYAQPDPAGHQRVCLRGECQKLLFPRIEPAVITLVLAPENGGPPRCLLGRHYGAKPDGWALVAGFVDVGESLEDAVRREVAEETGVAVGEVRYQASQAWPFPAGLMLGFRAVATDEAIAVDQIEMVEARWFTQPELATHLASRPRKHRDSIGMFLLEDWLGHQDRPQDFRSAD
ncbi:MAG: NAD(+) diphosphatase, partial [Actinomycetota bacterium]